VITLIALMVGIALAFAFLVWTRKQPDGGRRFYTIGLIVTALIYVVFALVGRGSARSLALEALGVLPYGAVAWLGLQVGRVPCARLGDARRLGCRAAPPGRGGGVYAGVIPVGLCQLRPDGSGRRADWRRGTGFRGITAMGRFAAGSLA
jgi:hypothetical protein